MEGEEKVPLPVPIPVPSGTPCTVAECRDFTVNSTPFCTRHQLCVPPPPAPLVVPPPPPVPQKTPAPAPALVAPVKAAPPTRSAGATRQRPGSSSGGSSHRAAGPRPLGVLARASPAKALSNSTPALPPSPATVAVAVPARVRAYEDLVHKINSTNSHRRCFATYCAPGAAASQDTTSASLRRFITLCHPVALDVFYCLGDAAPRVLVLDSSDSWARSGHAAAVLRLGEATGGKRARTAASSSSGSSSSSASASSHAVPQGIFAAQEALQYALRPGERCDLVFIDVLVSDAPGAGLRLLKALVEADGEHSLARALKKEQGRDKVVFCLEPTTPALADLYAEAGFRALSFRGGSTFMVLSTAFKNEEPEDPDPDPDDLSEHESAHKRSQFEWAPTLCASPGPPTVVGERPPWLCEALKNQSVALHHLLDKVSSAWEDAAVFGKDATLPAASEPLAVLSSLKPLLARLECERVRVFNRLVGRLGGNAAGEHLEDLMLDRVRRTLNIAMGRLASQSFFSPAIIKAAAFPPDAGAGSSGGSASSARTAEHERLVQTIARDALNLLRV